ncbi:FkbM family methyltransferase [Thermoactinomyces sp. DSM 45892]|uniref:FkbM family methyltransferase n=1 Tax=Thermoactinomyces sp. DSM 45892 TaxID=1882753 RepID=UPI000899EE29|nr:FkbM family methyltransferase [Thermoactinomyces sp. DSM 45892]SDX91859.1 Methyltransferase FkbM domain-containing protein [Thermoactinomyces sp. DSM 45892]
MEQSVLSISKRNAHFDVLISRRNAWLWHGMHPDLINQYNIRDVNFVKMDIEGGEYALIPCLKEFLEAEKPTFYASLHSPFLKENLNRQGLTELEAKNRFEQTCKGV